MDTQKFINSAAIIVLSAIVGLIAVLGLSHLQPGIHNHLQDGDKVCIDGGGFFPQMMPGPSPFLVCGIINGFEPDALETVDPPASYPEGSHRLEGVDSQT